MSSPDTSSSYVKFTLSEHEQLMGSILTYEQKMFIQNKISDIAEQMLGLVLDPNSYTVSIQQHAYLSGQLTILKHLLDCSTTSEQVLLNNASASVGNSQ